MTDEEEWPYGEWAFVDVPPAEVRMVEAAARLRPGVPWISTPLGEGTPFWTPVGRAAVHENGILAPFARLTVVEVSTFRALALGVSSGTASVAMLPETFVPFEMVRRIFPIELSYRRDSQALVMPPVWGLQVELMNLRTAVLRDEQDPHRLLETLSAHMGLRWDERYRHLPLRGWFENTKPPSYMKDGDVHHTRPVYTAWGDIFWPEGLRARRGPTHFRQE